MIDSSLFYRPMLMLSMFTLFCSFKVSAKSNNCLDACNNINWTSWTSFKGTSAIGTIVNGSENINVTMTSNFLFSSSPSIYNYKKFNSYPSAIPNNTVPQTTWSKGLGGTTEMCFSKTVTNPVLLIASLGNSAGLRAKLTFSKPYVVLFDGGNMEYHNSTSLTGIEGYAIIMFPGDFDCVTVNSTTEEFYTNITWGLRPPPFPVSISEIKHCKSTTLTASGGVSFKWNGGNTPNNATNTFETDGIYIVTVTDATGCQSSVSKEIVINNDILQASVSGATEGCGKVTLTAAGGTTYFWDGGRSPNNATNTFTESGTYNVTVTNSKGCTATIKQTVVVKPVLTPKIVISLSDIGNCLKNNFDFTAIYDDAGSKPRFKWFLNGSPVSTAARLNLNNLNNKDEVYCEITGDETCGISSISNKITVEVLPRPTLELPEELKIDGDGPKIITPVVSGDIVKYDWSPADGLDNTSIKNPSANPTATTLYTLVITTNNGCTSSAKVKVIVLQDIYIPNVFSPNGDSKNDKWLIRHLSDYVGSKVLIFNRHGQKVFQHENFIAPWDGTMNGQPLPMGTYYYILDLANKKQTRYTGSVTILR